MPVATPCQACHRPQVPHCYFIQIVLDINSDVIKHEYFPLVSLHSLANVLSLTANITKILHRLLMYLLSLLLNTPHHRLILRGQGSHDHSYLSWKYIFSASLSAGKTSATPFNSLANVWPVKECSEEGMWQPCTVRMRRMAGL